MTEGLVSVAAKCGFELVIFDTGAGVDETVLSLARHASEIVVVIEPDEISLYSALDLRGELLYAKRLYDLEFELYFLVNKMPDTRPIREPGSIRMLEPLPFDRKLHSRFVRDPRKLIRQGFSRTMFKRYVGRIARTVYGIPARGPTMLDFVSRNKTARVITRIAGYGILFVGSLVAIYLLVLFSLRPFYSLDYLIVP